MNLSETFWKMKAKDYRSFRHAIFFSLLFLILYLWSIDNLSFGVKDFSLSIRSNWMDLLLKERVAFIWEPIGSFSMGFYEFFISVPNILLGGSLAFLVFLNVFLGFFTYRMPKTCDVRPSGLLGVLPAALTGFACCAPTFLLALGPVASAFAAPFVKIRPFLIPVSFILLIAGFFMMMRNIPDF